MEINKLSHEFLVNNFNLIGLDHLWKIVLNSQDSGKHFLDNNYDFFI